MDEKDLKRLRQSIEKILKEQATSAPATSRRGRQIINYNPNRSYASSRVGPKFFGQRNPRSLEDVGLVHSLVTPAWETVSAAGTLAYGLISRLAKGVTSLLNPTFAGLALLGLAAAKGMGADIGDGRIGRFTKNLTSGALNETSHAHNHRDLQAYLQAVARDASQVVSDFNQINMQTDISSLGSSINNIFSDYSSDQIQIPSASDLLSNAIQQDPDPGYEALTPEERGQLTIDVEEYTVTNIKSEMKRVFLDILAQLKDYSGLQGGEPLASSPEALFSFENLFEEASNAISFS
jgi:hypothetical protein